MANTLGVVTLGPLLTPLEAGQERRYGPESDCFALRYKREIRKLRK